MDKKVALCFFISYNHALAKEALWRRWILENEDIIDVYFHYTDYAKIQSPWIKAHVLPKEYIAPTSYYHMVPAYLSALFYASWKEPACQWFCLLTESCVPLVPPAEFRRIFLENFERSVLNWQKAWWNTDFHKRANLRLLPPSLRLAHDPYFILSRRHVQTMHTFYTKQRRIFKIVCDGGLANESVFAVGLQCMGELDNPETLICDGSTATDWSRKTSPTSPHLFQYGDPLDIAFIRNALNKNPWRPLFLRKVHTDFPDSILEEIVFPNK